MFHKTSICESGLVLSSIHKNALCGPQMQCLQIFAFLHCAMFQATVQYQHQKCKTKTIVTRLVTIVFVFHFWCSYCTVAPYEMLLFHCFCFSLLYFVLKYNLPVYRYILCC